MKKFIEFLKLVNSKTGGKFFWFSYFVCNTMMLIALSINDVIAVTCTSEYTVMIIFTFFINNIVLSVCLAILVLLTCVFIKLTCVFIKMGAWFYKKLVPTIIASFKETYNIKSKKDIALEQQKEKEMQEEIQKVKDLIKPTKLTEGTWKR